LEVPEAAVQSRERFVVLDHHTTKLIVDVNVKLP